MNKKEEKRLIYLYCVTKAKPYRKSFKEIGIKIYPVYFQGVYAIVSRVSPDEFSENNLKKNLQDLEWVDKRVRQHEQIIEHVMQDATVIPFKFGTVFQTETNVKKMLKEKNTDFKKIIANLEGKEEWGLKIYCDPNKLKKVIKEKDGSVKEKEEKIVSAGIGKAYLLNKKKNELVKNIVNEKISEYTRDSFGRLKRTSLETKINKILPKEVTEKKDDMVLNAVFLVNKRRVKEFDSVFKYLITKYSGEGFNFDCTGPWPPYNFCSVKEKLSKK